MLSATLTTLATFNTSTEPGNLVIDSAGNLYGTTSGSGDGTLFEIAAHTHQITTLVTFNGANGADPSGLVVDANGNLFGTAAAGGDLSLGGGQGDGTIFEIAAGTHTVTTLAEFNGTNGSGPNRIIEDTSGNLYGSTTGGGVDDGGTIFKVAASSHALSTLSADTKGAPSAIDSAGNLYGTSTGDSQSFQYSVFEIPAVTGELKTLAQFGTADYGGLSPVTRDADGNLYATAAYGLYQLPAGSHTLSNAGAVSGLYFSSTGILVDSHGDLFGATSPYGGFGSAYAYEVAAGSHAVSTLVEFNGSNDGDPQGSLVADGAGNLYGTADATNPEFGTPAPGPSGNSVFEITSSGFAVGNSAPVIFTQPTGVTQLPGGIATFTATVGSTPSATVQWQESTDGGKTFATITGNVSATTETLKLTDLTASQNGTWYRAIFTNGLGSISSVAVKLAVVPLVFGYPASVSPYPITGTSTALRALADAANDETGIVYTWSIVHVPPGTARPTFDANRTGGARKTVVTFHKDGRYIFRCTISDREGDTLKSDVEVGVTQTVTAVRLSPLHQTVATGKPITFHAIVEDQFGHPMRIQPSARYSLASGPGTIDATTGVFSSPSPGVALIRADADDFYRTAGLQVIP